MTHELKIWPCYFERVKSGEKTFEYRINDRGFQMGDRVMLREYTESRSLSIPSAYTGREALFEIGYVLPVENNHVVFSLLSPTELNGVK